MDMDDWRGGLAKAGDVSPGVFVARRGGLVMGGCSDELRRGEPTWPKADAAALLAASSWRWRAKRAP